MSTCGRSLCVVKGPSETVVRAEEQPERGRGVYGCEVATIAAKGGTGGRGGTRRVLFEGEGRTACGRCV